MTPRKRELVMLLQPELFAGEERCVTPRKRELGVHLQPERRAMRDAEDERTGSVPVTRVS